MPDEAGWPPAETALAMRVVAGSPIMNNEWSDITPLNYQNPNSVIKARIKQLENLITQAEEEIRKLKVIPNFTKCSSLTKRSILDQSKLPPNPATSLVCRFSSPDDVWREGNFSIYQDSSTREYRCVFTQLSGLYSKSIHYK